MDKFPKDLFNDLSVAFAKQYTEENGEMNLSPDDFFPALESFIKSDFLAARIIDDYNKEQEIKRGTEVDTTEAPDIKIVINNTPVSLDELDETDIRGFLRTFEAELNSLQEKPDRTPEENTQLSKLKYNINGIKKFLQQQVRAGFSAEQKKTIDVLEKLIKEQNNILKTPNGYVINGQVMQRVTNVIKEFLPEYSYRDETAVRATFATTIGEQGFTVDSVKSFIDQLRKQKLGGFSEFTYTELEKDLNAMLADPNMLASTTEPSVQPAAKPVAKIFNPAAAEIKKEGNVVFGAAGKMNQSPSRINQDAVFVDQEKGIFIVADGMGGVDKVPFFQPQDASKLIIDYFRGIEGRSPINIIEDAYKANKNVKTEEVFNKLRAEGFIAKTSKYDDDSLSAIVIRAYLKVMSNPNDVSVLEKNAWIMNAAGAVGVKAQRVADNKYEIEHVGDAVFFVVDQNNKIKRAEGLSTSPYVDGFVWGVDFQGKANAKKADKINKYTVELKPGERLVLSSDFIETEDAIQDFIDTGFGENLDFDKFRRKHKNDDASFVVINYAEKGAETGAVTQPAVAAGNEQQIRDLETYFTENTKSTATRKYTPDLSGEGELPLLEQRKTLIDLGADKIQAHGIAKGTIGEQLKSLINILTKGISPDKGGGGGGFLFTAPLALTDEMQGLGAATGGSLKSDGAFVVLAKKGVNTIKSIDDIGGVLVNQAIADTLPEFVQKLKSTFPNLAIDSYSNSPNVVTELNTKTAAKTPLGADQSILDRILTLVSEKTYQASKDAGNYLDDQTRNLLDNVDPVFDETKITQKAFEEAFKVDDENPGYIRRIKDIIDKEGLYVVSRVKLEDGAERGFVVYDEDAGIAGEIDLLAVDRFGKLHIIDIKTGKTSKWAGFNNMEKGYSKKDNYTLQQLAYSNLLYNMTKMDSTISLLPIQIDYDAETSVISKVERPSAKDVLKPGTYRIALTPSEQIKANIESKIPRKTEVVETAVTEPANIIGEDFEMVEEPFDENLPVEEVQEGSPIENFKKVVSEATQEQLDSLKSELSIAIAKNMYSAADLIAIQEVLDERQRELDSNVQIKITSNNAQINSPLIANQTIFMDKNNSEIFASEGDDVVIIKVHPTDDIVTLKSLSNGKQKPVSFAELNKMFILKQTVMAFEEEEKEAAPLTKVEKNFVSESIDNVNELLKDVERKEALKKEAALETMDDIDTDLFDDDSSNC
jgi:hypothetical protein